MPGTSNFFPEFYLWTLLMVKISYTRDNPETCDVSRRGCLGTPFANGNSVFARILRRVNKCWKINSPLHFWTTKHVNTVEGACLGQSSTALNSVTALASEWFGWKGGALWRLRSPSLEGGELRGQRKPSHHLLCCFILSCSRAAYSKWQEPWGPNLLTSDPRGPTTEAKGRLDSQVSAHS